MCGSTSRPSFNSCRKTDVPVADTGGRADQKRRTRKDLLRAAARLMHAGRQPSLEEIAAEALVSRATAYRFFSGVEQLLVEASLDIAAPEPDELFRGAGSQDPVARLERVDTALHDMIQANEASIRMMLVNSLQHAATGKRGAAPVVRQNRRTPLIEAALAPARHEFRPAALKTLSQALAIVIGTEAMVVLKDVLHLDDAQARRVRRWAIRALVDAARKPETGS